MGKQIKAIETTYKGYRFRSRLEARWAVFFDALGIGWEYEKEGYDLGEAGWYLPDFWLPEVHCWVEVKPDNEAIDFKKLRAFADYRFHQDPAETVLVGVGIPSSISWNVIYGSEDGLWDTEQMFTEPLPNSAVIEMWTRIRYGRHDAAYEVRCPFCGSENVHFQNAINNSGHDNYEASDVLDVRGDVISLPMWCESGCRWLLAIGFHKGTTAWVITDARRACPPPVSWRGRDATEAAYNAARSARFEHGESGAPGVRSAASSEKQTMKDGAPFHDDSSECKPPRRVYRDPREEWGAVYPDDEEVAR